LNRISLSYQIWLLVFNLYILQVKDQAKKTVKEFKGLTSSEISSLTWNIVMIQVRQLYICVSVLMKYSPFFLIQLVSMKCPYRMN